MSLLASACVWVYSEQSIAGCKDLSVGEQTDLSISGVGEADVYDEEDIWTLESGPGTLEDDERFWRAHYTATEPGLVVISWEGFAEQRYRWGGEGRLRVTPVYYRARCTFEVFDATVDVPVALECETSRFKVEVGPRPVTAFHNGYIEFDTNVITMAGMNYDASEFELSVGGDDELLAGTLDPRVSQPGDTSQSFSWHVTIDRVTGQDLPLGEHQLEVTVTEDSGLSVGTMSCTLPFTIDIIQYGG
jgi:hypothetical protein